MTDDDRPPLLSLLFGYGPALLLLLIGASAWLVGDVTALHLLALGQLWAAAILIFLAGVRRGLSFFTAGGPRPAQVATSVALFVLGLGGLLAPPRLALAIIAAGYVAVAVLDPVAARQGEAPRHFARLRPPQMALFLVGLALLSVRSVGL